MALEAILFKAFEIIFKLWLQPYILKNSLEQQWFWLILQQTCWVFF